jgi:hypothetical protein
VLSLDLLFSPEQTVVTPRLKTDKRFKLASLIFTFLAEVVTVVLIKKVRENKISEEKKFDVEVGWFLSTKKLL